MRCNEKYNVNISDALMQINGTILHEQVKVKDRNKDGSLLTFPAVSWIVSFSENIRIERK